MVRGEVALYLQRYPHHYLPRYRHQTDAEPTTIPARNLQQYLTRTYVSSQDGYIPAENIIFGTPISGNFRHKIATNIRPRMQSR